MKNRVSKSRDKDSKTLRVKGKKVEIIKRKVSISIVVRVTVTNRPMTTWMMISGRRNKGKRKNKTRNSYNEVNFKANLCLSVIFLFVTSISFPSSL